MPALGQSHCRPRGAWSVDPVLACLLLIGAGLRFWLAMVTPLLFAPDETGHILYVHEAANLRLPENSSDWTWATSTGADEFFQPPLYYLLVAPVYRIFLATGPGAVYAVRCIDVLIGLALVGVTWRLARIALPGTLLTARVAAGIVALTPTVIGNTSSVNNDGLCALFVGLATVALVRSLRAPISWRETGWLALLVAGALWSKSAAVVLPALLVGAALWLRARGQPGALRLLLAAATGLGAVLPWWLFRNLRAYGSMLATGTNYPRWNAPLSDKVEAVVPVFSRTFWAAFGRVYEIFPFPSVSTLLSVAAFGCLAAVALRWRRLPADARASLVVLAAEATAITAAAVSFGLSAHQAQGRYTYYALPSIAVLLAHGASALVPLRLARSRRLGAVGLGLAAAYATLTVGIATLDFSAVTTTPVVGGVDYGAIGVTHDLSTWVQHRTVPVTR